MYVLTRQSSAHEGGTKFYDIALVRREDADMLASCPEIRHWGKLRSSKMTGGQMSLQSHSNTIDAENSSQRQITAKKKRGYEQWKKKTEKFDTLPDLLAYVTKHFGNSMSIKIKNLMEANAPIAMKESEVAPHILTEEEKQAMYAGDEDFGSW